MTAPSSSVTSGVGRRQGVEHARVEPGRGALRAQRERDGRDAVAPAHVGMRGALPGEVVGRVGKLRIAREGGLPLDGCEIGAPHAREQRAGTGRAAEDGRARPETGGRQRPMIVRPVAATAWPIARNVAPSPPRICFWLCNSQRAPVPLPIMKLLSILPTSWTATI